MKITKLRLRQVEGVLEHPDPFWESRLVRPLDIYLDSKKQSQWFPYPVPLGGGRYRLSPTFLEIETNEGVTGLSGPVGEATAFYISTQLQPVLMGADPAATELLWDKMYRLAIHGRKGDNMMAISAVDNALWDIKGKWLRQPVYRLLGGPTREKIPAYASCLGYSHDPEKLKVRVKEFQKQGYRHMKWFFQDGPGQGLEGIRRNVALARTLREASGDDVEIMLDAWNSWDVAYTVKMARLLDEYHPYWLEEPVLADKPESYAEVTRQVHACSGILVSGGEHEYTRWGFKMLMQMGAMDIYQADAGWSGGISEMLKICALASAFDTVVIPHGGPVPATVHLLFSQPPNTCPLVEYLIKWNQLDQFFYKKTIEPVNGFVTPPEGPGMGVELDESKIESEREIKYGAKGRP
jgi:L-alanine-DL-glutamate epimerase-like enolase superfamily enzyme